MTTIRDLLSDLIKESMQFGSENSTVFNTKLAEEKREELLDEYVGTVRERIVG